MQQKEYCIDVPKLKLGKHYQEFLLDNNFFEGHEEIDGADLTAKLEIDRTTMHLDVHYRLEGILTLLCDRCLKPFPFSVEADHRVVYSFDKDMKETEDTEVVFIPRSIHLLDLRQDLWDFTTLKIPLRRIPAGCPNDSCPTEILKYLQKEGEQQTEEQIDPRWEVLKSLKLTSESDSE